MLNRRIVCLFSILIIIFGAICPITIGFTSNILELGSKNRELELIFLEGDQIITPSNPVTYNDSEIYIKGDLIIQAGATFKLVRSILMINYTGEVDRVYKILVEGRLEANDSTIRNNKYENNKYDFEFAEGSSGLIEGSEIKYCGELNKTGLVVRSDFVSFINTTLDFNYIGINCQGAEPTIENCTIKNSDYVSVLCNNSNLIMVDCELIHDEKLRIILEGSSNVKLLSTPIASFLLDIYEYIEFSDNSKLHVLWWLEVQVNNATGPLMNAQVKIFDKYDFELFTRETDSSGEIEKIEILEFIQNKTERNITTPHTLVISKDDYKTINREITIDVDTFVNQTLESLQKNGWINGVVKDEEGKAIENANVSIEVKGVTYWTLTDADGEYLLTDLPVGENYTVLANGFINNLSAYEIGMMDNVSILPDQVIEVNFELIKKPLPVNVQVTSRDKTIDAKDAVDVDRDTEIQIDFVYPMQVDSVRGNFSLLLDGNETKGTFSSLDASIWKKFSFKPLKELDWDTQYTINLTRAVLRLDTGDPSFWEDFGITFRTEFYPVIAFQPQDGSIDVDTKNPGIFIRFHDDVKLNITSLSNNVKLYDPDDNIVPGTVNILSNLLNQVQFVPSDELKGETTYTLKISDNLRDTDGKPIFHVGPDFARSFKTKYVVPKIIITGKITDEDGKILKVASVVVKDENDNSIGSDFSDNVTGIFSIEFRGEPGDYKLKITPNKDYKIRTINFNITEGEFTKDLGDIELINKDDGGEDEGFALDQNFILILIIIIVIIIIIILAIFVLGRKKEAHEEEYLAEAADTGRTGGYEPARPTYAKPSTVEPRYTTSPAETMVIPMVTASAYRCPNCGHRLSSLGECFHCEMKQKYGIF